MSSSSGVGRVSGTPSIKLAQNGNNDLLRKYLKEHPEEINSVDFSGDNLVSVACWHGHFDTVTMLLDEFDLNVNHANLQGVTALHRCCGQNNSAIALLLIHKGADPYIKDNLGRSCLECCNAKTRTILNEKMKHDLDVANEMKRNLKAKDEEWERKRAGST